MSKRTILLIVVLIVVTVGLFVIALLSINKQTPPQINTTGSTPTVTPTPPAHTILALDPTTVTMASSSGSINVTINTNGDNITAVQLELQYDPAVLTNVKLTPGTFLPDASVLINNVDPSTGRISYALIIASPTGAKSGSGTIATLSFSTLPTTKTQTDIIFLPKSLVTAVGIDPSVLKSTTNTTIILPK